MTASLTMVETAVNAFNGSRDELKTNNAYYDSTHRPQAIGMATPVEMQKLLASIGWCRVYLDSIEERLNLQGFRLAGAGKADDKLWKWWQANKLDEFAGLGHREALKHGRAYVAISVPDKNDPLADKTCPIIRVFSPAEMYAEIDRRNDRVKWAIRVIDSSTGETNEIGQQLPNVVTLYMPMFTAVYERGVNGWVETERVDHKLGIVPVVPLLNRTNLNDVHGTSEISNELRDVTDVASRTMMNMAATMELMAIPQRLLFGVDRDELMKQSGGSTYQAYIARILAFTDENAQAQQFQAAELRNFTEVMQELTKQAATYTGLPPQYLSFSSDNPASAEAIRSSESRLVTKCERKATIFGSAWEQVMRIAMLVMGETLPEGAYRMESIWGDPATPTFAAQADAVTKLVSTTSGDGRALVPVEMGRIKLGFSVEERRQMDVWDKEAPKSQLAGLLAPPAAPQFQAPRAPTPTGVSNG